MCNRKCCNLSFYDCFCQTFHCSLEQALTMIHNSNKEDSHENRKENLCFLHIPTITTPCYCSIYRLDIHDFFQMNFEASNWIYLYLFPPLELLWTFFKYFSGLQKAFHCLASIFMINETFSRRKTPRADWRSSTSSRGNVEKCFCVNFRYMRFFRYFSSRFSTKREDDSNTIQSTTFLTIFSKS